jgi:hypothetical protein
MRNSSEVDKRRWLAEIVAPAYAANPKVAAVLLAGSVARGQADEYSDIEIDIFWHTPPSDADLLGPIERSGWPIQYRHVDEFEWADGFFIEGIKVDTSQFLVATLDSWIEDVIERADLEVEKQIRITAIQHGRPLHGADLIERWRARVAEYPDTLSRAMIVEHIDFQPRAQLEMQAARNHTLLLYRGLVGVAQQIFDVLMGLNRVYLPHPYHKWLDWEVEHLMVTPPELAARLRRMFAAEPRAAVAIASQLIEETFALIEQHMPDLDIATARSAFELQRVIVAAE